METLPITEAKARIAELADRAAREHDRFTLTKNGRPAVIIMSVAEYESLMETLEILSDPETMGDLRESAQEAENGDFCTTEQIRADLEKRRRRAAA